MRQEYANFFAGLGDKGDIFGDSGNDKETLALVVEGFFNVFIVTNVRSDIKASFFVDFANGTNDKGFVLVNFAFGEAPAGGSLPATNEQDF